MDVKIDFIGHATIYIESGTVRLLFDPHLFDTYRHGLFGYYPERNVNYEQLCGSVDIVIISHSHRDHFDPASLRYFDKNTTFIIPNDARIQYALSSLGFKGLFLIEDWVRLKLSSDFEIVVTPSTYRVPEHGYLMLINGVSIWNLVDSHVKDTWCERVKSIIGNKKLDYILIPTQPLIEGNSTSVVPPYATSNRANEASVVIDILHPTYSIPFADGHFCKGRSYWLNYHWMPFDSYRKWASIDKAKYKTQILTLNAGDSIYIVNEPGVISHKIGQSQFVNILKSKDRPSFFPGYYISPLASYGEPSKYALERLLNSLFSVENLEKTSKKLSKYKINCIPAEYRFSLIGRDGGRMVEKSIKWDGRSFTREDIGECITLEVACGSSEFKDLFDSKMEFSAALIGGFLREAIIRQSHGGIYHVFRSLADLVEPCENWVLSGIFVLNQLLMNERNRAMIEIDRSLNKECLTIVPDIDEKQIWSRYIETSPKVDRVSQFVINIVHDLFKNQVPFWKWSREYIYEGEPVFIGFMDGREWVIGSCDKVIIVPVNLMGPQSIYGCGVGSSVELSNVFMNNINNLDDKEISINLGVIKNRKIPNWRLFDLFPSANRGLVETLHNRGIEIDEDLAKVVELNYVWWLGYPPPTNLAESCAITIRNDKGKVIRGTLNSAKNNRMAFKNQLSFVAAMNTDEDDIIQLVIDGNLRLSWTKPESEWVDEGLHDWSDVSNEICGIASKLCAMKMSEKWHNNPLNTDP